MASANTTGGVMGKMIDAQSIVVAAAATGEGGKKARSSARSSGTASRWRCWSAAIVWLYAHVFPGWSSAPCRLSSGPAR